MTNYNGGKSPKNAVIGNNVLWGRRWELPDPDRAVAEVFPAEAASGLGLEG